MTDKVLILVTAPNRHEALKIARHLVENRLAACVNISSPVQSVYRWEGKLQEGKEFQLSIKSTRELFPDVQREILKVHGYKVPEIICIPIVDGLAEYLAWISESVGQPVVLDLAAPGEEPED